MWKEGIKNYFKTAVSDLDGIQREKGKGKGKAFPLQAWTNPEGSRRLRVPDFEIIGT